MKIWGYIFIFLNIVAAGAFVYFATQVWKARTEWQLAVVKQQLAIDGIPLEAVPAPSDLQEDSVPFYLQVGGTAIHQIRKPILEAAIPNGGVSRLAVKGQLVTNQDEEVKRIEPIVFQSFALEKRKLDEKGEKEYDLLTPEKRQQLAVTLLSLANTSMRRGIYSLYRDLDVDGRYEWARDELYFLGRTQPQQTVLHVLAAIGRINEAINLSETPEVVKHRIFVARVAIARWLLSEIPHAAPITYKSPYAAADSPEAKNEEYELLQSKLKPLIDPDEDNDPLNFEVPPVVMQSLKDLKVDFKPTELLKNFPKGLLLKFVVDKDEAAAKAKAEQHRMRIDAAVKELRDQLTAETGFKSPSATLLVPFLADIAGNALETREQVDSARKRLQELMDLRATSTSEKKAYAALIEVLFAPKPFAQQKEDDRYHREKNIDDVGLELLRSYFEEALAKPASATDLPEDPAQARAKIAGIKPLRDLTQKRKDIAYLLYHLDGYLAIDWVKLTDKTVGGARGQYYDGNIQVRSRWFRLMFPALPANNPQDDTLGNDEKDTATKLLDQLHKERADWHKRVAAIVGLKTYVESVEARASELSKVMAKLQPILKEDQRFYEKERQDLIFWIIELNRHLDRRYSTLDEEEAIRAKWKSDHDAREAELLALRKDHDKAKTEAKTSLTDLEKKVAELFSVTKRLGEAQDALVGLELQLRNIEFARRTPPPMQPRIDK